MQNIEQTLELLGGLKVLPKRYQKKGLTDMDVITLVEDGLPASSVRAFAQVTKFTVREVCSSFLPISVTTYNRKKASDHLGLDTSSRLVQAAELYMLGGATFGGISEFKEWMREESDYFKCKPMTLTRSSQGMRLVMDELVRIQHGIFA